MPKMYRDGAEIEVSDNPDGVSIMQGQGWSVDKPKSKPKKDKADKEEAE